MEEDEDVLLEGSPLYNHLRDLGYTDLASAPSSFRSPISLSNRKTRGETIECSVVDEVLALRASNLLFEDDLEHIDCIFASFELAKNEYFKYMFQGKSCAFFIALGLFIYMYLGSYAFVLLSAYYVYRTAKYHMQKRTRMSRLKSLMEALQNNFELLMKVIKFLHENEQMMRSRNALKSSHKALNFVASLKSDFVKFQDDINDILTQATLELIAKIELCDYLENPESYICQRVEMYKTEENISQRHSLYMLLQSQFLTRLIFSLIPNLVNQHGDDQDQVIHEVVTGVTVRLNRIQSSLSKKFRFALLNGVFLENTSDCPLPPKPRVHKASNELFLRNIHELSNNLQFCLVLGRDLESMLESENPVDIAENLKSLQSEILACHKYISDILILHKKYESHDKALNVSAAVDSEEPVSEPSLVATFVDHPDLNPNVEDDVLFFEMADESTAENAGEWEEHVDWHDPFLKTRQKDLLRELKSRLKAKAEDWSKREAAVLNRKGVSLPNYDMNGDGDWGLESDDDYSPEELKYAQSVLHDEEEIKKRLSKPQKYQYEADFETPEGAELFAKALRQNGLPRPRAFMQEEEFCADEDESSE